MFLSFPLANVLRATTACTFFDIATSKSGPNLVCFVRFYFEMCFSPQLRALFRHLNFQKCSEHEGVFIFFTCTWLQRRALVRHRNFHKWSEPGVLCTCLLRNVLLATTACTFSTSQLSKVVRAWCVLHILTWKCASHHNGVQFFISHLTSWLRTRRFSEPTFWTLRSPKSLEKHSVSWLSYFFAHLDLLSSDSFSFFFSSLLWLFPSLLFICPYCRKFDF